mmetsp:Transcript_25366/g.83900  ORF Transcript_25366/g.83900 Transcript_25366/m.83900 type:complete len:707 (-) Transcript_25366:41-2161(-)
MLGTTLNRKKHRRVSYVIRASDEGRHRSGINSIALSRRGDLLFSAGRDATTRCWNTANPKAVCERTYDGHTDWVNDVVVMSDEATLVTASSDTTIKFWNIANETCTATLKEHCDYVKALAYARNAQFLASAGLDRDVYIWDTVALQKPVAQMPDSQFRRCEGHKDSVYCIATNNDGKLVVSGSTERVSTHAIGLIRLWDPRTGERTGRLKGHTDNIRCILLSEDGTKCISGSSDATIKIWDIGQQRCIQSIAIHTDSVWSIALDPQNLNLYSGGKDCNIFCTDLRTLDSTLLHKAADPVTKLLLSPARSLWVSTVSADLQFLDVEPLLVRERASRSTRSKPSVHSITIVGPRRSIGSSSVGQEAPDENLVPLLANPTHVIKGLPAIVKHDFLENRRCVLTEDTAGDVALWDVTKAQKIQEYGKVDFRETRKSLEKELLVPAWCTVDCKLGSLTVNLDFPQVFSAELYANDAGFPHTPELEETKMNVGFRILRSLLKRWLQGRRVRPQDRSPMRQQDGDEGASHTEIDESLDYTISDKIKVIISEDSGTKPLICRRVFEWDGSEPVDILPEWLVQSLERDAPHNDKGERVGESPKVGFYLTAHPDCDIRQMQQGKLNAPQILRARKVLHYAMTKLQLDTQIPAKLKRPDVREPFDYLELVCNERIVPLDMNLMTIRKYVAKNPDELVLQYRWKESMAKSDSAVKGFA